MHSNSLSGVVVVGVGAAIVLVYKIGTNQDAKVTFRSPDDQ